MAPEICDMLKRLIYKSRCLCSKDEARIFCDQAKSRNAVSGLSGALYLVNGVFVQYLEGDDVALSALFPRIQLDLRHEDCRLLDSRPISRRLFEGWHMAWLPHTVGTELLTKALLPSGASIAELSASTAGPFFLVLAQDAQRQ